MLVRRYDKLRPLYLLWESYMKDLVSITQYRPSILLLGHNECVRGVEGQI